MACRSNGRFPSQPVRSKSAVGAPLRGHVQRACQRRFSPDPALCRRRGPPTLPFTAFCYMNFSIPNFPSIVKYEVDFPMKIRLAAAVFP